MTKAKELLDHGQLADAVDAQTQAVKASPTDVQSRLFLFELLCFAGDLGRAEKQLDVIAHQSADMEVGVAVIREVLAAESKRRAVFGLGKAPD